MNLQSIPDYVQHLKSYKMDFVHLLGVNIFLSKIHFVTTSGTVFSFTSRSVDPSPNFVGRVPSVVSSRSGRRILM